MKKITTTRRTAIAGFVAAGAASAAKAAPAPEPARILQQAFDLGELSKQNAEEPGPWLPFFENGTTLAGLYQLAAGATDGQPVHTRDEIYVVTRGAAKLRAGDEIFPAGPGSIFFVAAGIVHRFEEITEDLQVIVFFSKAAPGN
jgi:mannose-6-phosphate isomerase-like protein (cupin superfamily)